MQEMKEDMITTTSKIIKQMMNKIYLKISIDYNPYQGIEDIQMEFVDKIENEMSEGQTRHWIRN
jgi:hypothetical protein